jgi:F-type H+-transporting ATPase subunit epsilon
VVTPEREVWSGDARMIVARGIEGEVGILSGHTPLLIRLAIGELRIWHEETIEYAVVDGGFLHVASAYDVTRVDVLAEHAEMASEIDRRAAEFRLEEARRRLELGDDATAHAELAKALARVNLGK